jgi:histidine ammonia-lyase
MIELDRPEDLTPDSYNRIVHGGEAVSLGDRALRRVEQSREAFLKHLADGALCYGVNTGLGALIGIDLSEEDQRTLPRHILLGRSAAVGPVFAKPVVRGAMLIKLVQLLTGRSAVTLDLCRFIADRLNDGFLPVVPSLGLGMAGEIIPLCHLAQTFLGEGFVTTGEGGRSPARAWFESRGIPPYEPRSKEGLALIGGVAMAPAAAFEAIARLKRTLSFATVAAAASVEGLAAATEAYGEDVGRLRTDPGLADVAALMRRLLAGSRVTRAERQPPVSFRVIPQVHGVCLSAIRRLEQAIVREWSAIGDNPAFIADEGEPRLVHSGNFHCAELTAEVEAASLAVSQVALLSERRLHRCLDARYSGLAPQLARRPGLDAGLIILHKAALGLTAKIKSLAVPPSLQHGESSLGQEDFMTMVFPALDRLADLDRLTRLVASYELYAASVAIDQRSERPGDGVAAALRVLRSEIPAYHGDRPYGAEVEWVAELVDSGRLPLPELG